MTFIFSWNSENSHRTGKSVCARTNRPEHRKMQKGVEPGKPGNESSLSSNGASDNAKGTGFQGAVSLGLRCESSRHSTDRNRIGHQTQGRLTCQLDATEGCPEASTSSWAGQP